MVNFIKYSFLDGLIMEKNGKKPQQAKPPPDIPHKETVDRIIECTSVVFNAVGPGLSSRIYEEAIVKELQDKGLSFARNQGLRIKYKDVLVGTERISFVVDDRIGVSLREKGESLGAARRKMMLFLRASKKDVGVVLDFDSPKVGIDIVVEKPKNENSNTTKQDIN
jgi:GxxExxY protein